MLSTRNEHRDDGSHRNAKPNNANCGATSIAPRNVATSKQDRRDEHVGNSAMFAPVYELILIRVDD